MKWLATLLGVLVWSQAALPQNPQRFDLLPYTAYSSYRNTFSKDYTLIAGIYGYYGHGLEHVLEVDASFSRIRYGEVDFFIGNQVFRSEPVDIDQGDVTLAYTNYSLPNLKVRLGGHAIFSEDSFTDKGYIVFGGLHHYRQRSYTGGVDVYASFYNRYVPDLRVVQVTGQFGFYFGNYFTSGRFYAQTRGYYVELSEQVGFPGRKYASVEQALFYFYKDLVVEGFWWAGYQVFGVRNDGFVVYNLAEKHLGGLGGSLRYIIGDKTSLKLRISQGRFKELGVDGIAKSLNTAFIFGYTW